MKKRALVGSLEDCQRDRRHCCWVVDVVAMGCHHREDGLSRERVVRGDRVCIGVRLMGRSSTGANETAEIVFEQILDHLGPLQMLDSACSC
jgi:hypothetical protein